ncbi:MAG: MATE family efflux transporter [Oscillospiraceae bacterium]|nr:MATE family efflux transporter [Oscillospiraceae bacterium]
MKLSWLGDRAFFRRLISIAIPIALQNLLVNSSTMIDTMMIGTLGETSLAAVGLSSQYASLYFTAFFGFASGGIMFFSQYWGSKNIKGIQQAYGLALTCMLIVGFTFGGMAVFAPRFVLGVYTDKQYIIDVGVSYMRVIGFMFPLQSLSFAISCLLRSTERVRIPLVASVAAQLTNILGNWLLIFGNWGFPKMGVAGAALGSIAGAVVNVVVLYICCVRTGDSIVLRFREQFGWPLSFIKLYFVKCAPIIANEMFYGVGQLGINIIMGRQAAEGIAALAIFRVIERIVFVFFGGFTNASAVIVGKQVGAGELATGHRDAKRFALLCPAATFMICMLIFPLRAPILAVFGLSGASHSLGMSMLAVYTVAGTLRTCNYIINDTFRASGETVFGTVIELSCLFFITLPSVWLAGIVFRAPYIAVFSLVFIDDLVRIPVVLWYLRSGRWVKPVTEEGKLALPLFKEGLKAKGQLNVK